MSRDCTQGQKCYNCKSISGLHQECVLMIVQAAKSAISLATAHPRPPKSVFATSASSQATSRRCALTKPHHDITAALPNHHESIT